MGHYYGEMHPTGESSKEKKERRSQEFATDKEFIRQLLAQEPVEIDLDELQPGDRLYFKEKFTKNKVGDTRVGGPLYKFVGPGAALKRRFTHDHTAKLVEHWGNPPDKRKLFEVYGVDKEQMLIEVAPKDTYLDPEIEPMRRLEAKRFDRPLQEPTYQFPAQMFERAQQQSIQTKKVKDLLMEDLRALPDNERKQIAKTSLHELQEHYGEITLQELLVQQDEQE